MQAEKDAAASSQGKRRAGEKEGKYTTRAEIKEGFRQRREEWEKELEERRAKDPEYQRKEKERKERQSQMAKIPSKRIETPDPSPTTLPTKSPEARFPKTKPTASADPKLTDKQIQAKIEKLEQSISRYHHSDSYYRQKIDEIHAYFGNQNKEDVESIQTKQKEIEEEVLENSEHYTRAKKQILEKIMEEYQKTLGSPKWDDKTREAQLDKKRKSFVFSDKDEDDTTITITRSTPRAIDYRGTKGGLPPEEFEEVKVSSKKEYNRLNDWFENDKTKRMAKLDQKIYAGITAPKSKGEEGKVTHEKKLKQLKDYLIVLEIRQKLHSLKSRLTLPKKVVIPDDSDKENSYFDWMSKYLFTSGIRDLKQARKYLLDAGITRMSDVKQSWRNNKDTHHAILKDIKQAIEREKSIVSMGKDNPGIDITMNKEKIENLKWTRQTLNDLLFKANKGELGQTKGEGRGLSLQQKNRVHVLRDMLEFKVRGEEYQPAYNILIQGYLKGGRIEAYINAIKRKKQGESLKDLKGLNRKEKDVLHDKFGDDKQGWRILAEIFKEKGIYVPKSYTRESDEKIWQKIESASKGIGGLSNDMHELQRILDSEDPHDDVEYIVGADAQGHIQQLLFITERNYNNMADDEKGRDVSEAQDVVMELGIFYGKLAYIAKYINDNMEPTRKLRVSNKMLGIHPLQLTYGELDKRFGDILSDRVKTILENPENWGEKLEQQEIERGKPPKRTKFQKVPTHEEHADKMRQSYGPDKKIHQFRTKEEAEKEAEKYLNRTNKEK